MRGFPILLITLPGALGAQAPTITPAGDPSVNSDTIYALAVDPADHAGEDHILLLDDGVVRVEPDGRIAGPRGCRGLRAQRAGGGDQEGGENPHIAKP